MAIHRALSEELIGTRPTGSAISTVRTSTLYATQHLVVFRMILLSGNVMPEHEVIGELTVQCLEGSVEFSIGSARDVVRPGDLRSPLWSPRCCMAYRSAHDAGAGSTQGCRDA